jgi:hypothetical protein
LYQTAKYASLFYFISVFCPFRGRLQEGKVLIVGIIAKYEYRPYAKGIGQNELIEYVCHEGYHRTGPVNATCDLGQWNPINLPVCIPNTAESE